LPRLGENKNLLFGHTIDVLYVEEQEHITENLEYVVFAFESLRPKAKSRVLPSLAGKFLHYKTPASGFNCYLNI
jgi:hypothetical protein